MDRELYVKMTDKEFELFKQLMPLEKHLPEELAAALYLSIRNAGGCTTEGQNACDGRKVLSAHVVANGYDIELQIKKPHGQ